MSQKGTAYAIPPKAQVGTAKSADIGASQPEFPREARRLHRKEARTRQTNARPIGRNGKPKQTSGAKASVAQSQVIRATYARPDRPVIIDPGSLWERDEIAADKYAAEEARQIKLVFAFAAVALIAFTIGVIGGRFS